MNSSRPHPYRGGTWLLLSPWPCSLFMSYYQNILVSSISGLVSALPHLLLTTRVDTVGCVDRYTRAKAKRSGPGGSGLQLCAGTLAHTGTDPTLPVYLFSGGLGGSLLQDVCDRCGPSIIEADPSVYLKLLTHLVMRLGLLVGSSIRPP